MTKQSSTNPRNLSLYFKYGLQFNLIAIFLLFIFSTIFFHKYEGNFLELIPVKITFLLASLKIVFIIMYLVASLFFIYLRMNFNTEKKWKALILLTSNFFFSIFLISIEVIVLVLWFFKRFT